LNHEKYLTCKCYNFEMINMNNELLHYFFAANVFIYKARIVCIWLPNRGHAARLLVEKGAHANRLWQE